MFDRHAARDKIVIEAVTTTTVPPHGQMLWGLAKVTSSAMWAQYMDALAAIHLTLLFLFSFLPV